MEREKKAIWKLKINQVIGAQPKKKKKKQTSKQKVVAVLVLGGNKLLLSILLPDRLFHNLRASISVHQSA